MNEPSLLLSDNTCAELAEVSRSTYWRYVRDGIMPPPIRLGGVTRWRRDEVVAAIDKLTAQRDSARKTRGRVTS